jgi:hypothetical protein
VDIADKYEVEFHETLIVAIPSLVQFLEHPNYNVPSAAVSVLEKLANHGELQLSIMWRSLMLMLRRLSRGAESRNSITRSTA